MYVYATYVLLLFIISGMASKLLLVLLSLLIEQFNAKLALRNIIKIKKTNLKIGATHFQYCFFTNGDFFSSTLTYLFAG